MGLGKTVMLLVRDSPLFLWYYSCWHPLSLSLSLVVVVVVVVVDPNRIILE